MALLSQRHPRGVAVTEASKRRCCYRDVRVALLSQRRPRGAAVTEMSTRRCCYRVVLRAARQPDVRPPSRLPGAPPVRGEVSLRVRRRVRAAPQRQGAHHVHRQGDPRRGHAPVEPRPDALHRSLNTSHTSPRNRSSCTNS